MSSACPPPAISDVSGSNGHFQRKYGAPRPRRNVPFPRSSVLTGWSAQAASLPSGSLLSSKEASHARIAGKFDVNRVEQYQLSHQGMLYVKPTMRDMKAGNALWHAKYQRL